MTSHTPIRSTRPLRPLRAWLVSAVALAGLATFASHASPGDREHHGSGHRMHAVGWGHGAHRGGAGEMAWRLAPRVLDRVEATPEQREKIRAIADAARTDLRAQHEAGRALRQRSMALLSQPEVDAAALEALRKGMLAQHDRVSQRQMQALLEATRVLTPEQRKRLSEDMGRRRDMMERHHPGRHAPEAPKS